MCVEEPLYWVRVRGDKALQRVRIFVRDAYKRVPFGNYNPVAREEHPY